MAETFLKRKQLSGEIGSPQVCARALSAAGRLALNQSDYVAAAAYEEAALAIFLQTHDPWRQALSWNGLALIAEKQSQFDEATARYQQALMLFTEVGDPYNMGRVAMNVGNVALLRGELTDAADWYARGIDFLRAILTSCAIPKPKPSCAAAIFPAKRFGCFSARRRS